MSLRIEQPKNGTARSYRRLHFVLESQTFQRLSGTAESCATAKLSRGNPQGRCRGICSERTIGITKKSRTTPAHTYKEAQKSKKKSSVLIQLSAWLRTLDMVRMFIRDLIITPEAYNHIYTNAHFQKVLFCCTMYLQRRILL